MQSPHFPMKIDETGLFGSCFRTNPYDWPQEKKPIGATAWGLGALAGDRHRSTTTSDIGAFFNANLGGKVWHLIHLISGGTF